MTEILNYENLWVTILKHLRFIYLSNAARTSLYLNLLSKTLYHYIYHIILPVSIEARFCFIFSTLFRDLNKITFLTATWTILEGVRGAIDIWTTFLRLSMTS